MLNMTKVELQLTPDLNMYIFFKKCTRDGFSYIFHRYSKVNNKYLKSYDPKQNQNIYLDAYNLYGNAMFKFLPTSGFKWIELKELNEYLTIV